MNSLINFRFPFVISMISLILAFISSLVSLTMGKGLAFTLFIATVIAFIRIVLNFVFYKEGKNIPFIMGILDAFLIVLFIYMFKLFVF